jgi:thymidylate synthase
MIPVLNVCGVNIPDAWEQSLEALYTKGIDIPTQYDKVGDIPSKDATMILTVAEPLSEPMIHLDMPGGFEDLQEYVMEVCDGIKDHWIRDSNDPNDKRWEYTYHQKLFNYNNSINQIDNIIKQLKDTPYTRRAQGVTWNVREDSSCYDPPCFCAGTKIKTPTGTIDIKDIQNGDLVYYYDHNQQKINVNKVTKFFTKKSQTCSVDYYYNTINVSHDQLLYTSYGWKKAIDLTNNDKIRISTICSGCDVTDFMIVGYMHGDGWLSSEYKKHKDRKNPIQRCDVCFSIHPRANDQWIIEYLSKNSNNTITNITKEITSQLVSGMSKKIKVTDKNLWYKLYNLKCPVGKKQGKILLKTNDLTDQQCKDFLTGIYSAEGCIQKHSIQLGMHWMECIDFISELLYRFNIHHTKFQYDNIYKIHIDKTDSIIQMSKLFDFRLDSRKQSKFINLLCAINNSQKIFNEKIQRIKIAKEMYKNGKKQKYLRQNIACYNSRWLKKDYTPTFRLYYIDTIIQDCLIDIPVNNIKDMGITNVFDFEISHQDHSIIANDVISHNCLQSTWFRIINNKLCMNVRFRSNDAYKAAFMNIFALVQLQKRIADELNVEVGRYCHIADSYHIYGKDIPEFENRFLNALHTRSFEQRTMRYENVKDIMDDAIPEILKKVI